MMTELKHGLAFLFGVLFMGLIWWAWWLVSCAEDQAAVIFPLIGLLLGGFFIIGSVFVFFGTYWNEK